MLSEQLLIKNVPLVGKDQVPWTFKVLLKKLTRVGVSCAGDVPGGDGGDDGDGDGDTHGASAGESNENQEKMVLVSPFAVLKYLPLTSLSTSRVDSTF